ncbi:hypothetical protein QYF61_012824 [Mycteria americana]|uniref:Uncharacterized protein n=1 Tax=Mycteria americana TaxID=33587 RepID=A0AAN7MY58_MYCAM|nr:hypothetical protein QYF61_012824 [Mycteria americana]
MVSFSVTAGRNKWDESTTLGEVMECMLNKFADGTKFWYAQGQGCHSDGSKQAAGMDNWDFMKFIKDKCQVLYLGRRSLLQLIQAGEQLCRKAPGVLADRELLKSSLVHLGDFNLPDV